jgi:hypothetical protein
MAYWYANSFILVLSSVILLYVGICDKSVPTIFAACLALCGGLNLGVQTYLHSKALEEWYHTMDLLHKIVHRPWK